MNLYFSILFSVSLFNFPDIRLPILIEQKSEITCSENGCTGTYSGPEFISKSDIAHQFSNKMSKEVGTKLKELYKNGTYVKVDFPNIQMSTEGMGSGNVTYTLTIPFIAVEKKCAAYTSFDHVGGWNHTPNLISRKNQLSRGLMDNGTLDISTLKTTPEGLQEYWIQWKNQITQSECP
ncbi:MAG: hypothetical protein ACI85Q_002066 [Salibacteraceae bacterium]|jgi:hypothetical protein